MSHHPTGPPENEDRVPKDPTNVKRAATPTYTAESTRHRRVYVQESFPDIGLVEDAEAVGS